MNSAQRMQAGIWLVVGLAGCHSATKLEQMQNTQDALLKEARALQQCEHANGYGSDQCASQRAAYQNHLSAFRAGAYDK
jgi:hypothetical protein